MKVRVYRSRVKLKELKENLKQENYEEKNKKKFKDQSVKLSLFIEKHPKSLPEWIDEVVSLFSLDNNDFSDELMQYNGAIIAETQKNIYMVPFGHAFWTLERNADLNFGMDFAERAMKEDNITLKGVSFIQRNKMRGVMNYKKGQNEFPQASESYFTVSGLPDFEQVYGKNIDCGIGVKFQKSFNMLPKSSEQKELNIQKLVQLFNEIDTTMELDTQSSIPRLQTLKKNDPKSLELDDYFLKEITNSNPSTTAKVDIDINRIQLTGDNIEIIDNRYELEIYITSKKSSKTSKKININSDEIHEYILNYKDEITALDRIKVKILDTTGDTVSRLIDLRSIMYCELEKDGQIFIYQNGAWGYLNGKFLDLLNKKMQEVDEVVKFDKRFDLTYKNPTHEKEEKGEGAYIEALCENKDFTKLHRRNVNVSGTSVEVADVYCKKNDELVAIKRGTDTTLAIYSFEQSLLSIQAISNPESFKVKEKLTEYNTKLDDTKLKHENITALTINKIIKSKNSSVLWLVNDKVKYIYEGVEKKDFKASSFKSILLKLKILNWYSFCKEYGYEPTLYFAIDRPEILSSK